MTHNTLYPSSIIDSAEEAYTISALICYGSAPFFLVSAILINHPSPAFVPLALFFIHAIAGLFMSATLYRNLIDNRIKELQNESA